MCGRRNEKRRRSAKIFLFVWAVREGCRAYACIACHHVFLASRRADRFVCSLSVCYSTLVAFSPRFFFRVNFFFIPRCSFASRFFFFCCSQYSFELRQRLSLPVAAWGGGSGANRVLTQYLLFVCVCPVLCFLSAPKEREGEVLRGEPRRRTSLDLKQFIDKV